jgi:ABC-2 type transport system ATP-binding protein
MTPNIALLGALRTHGGHIGLFVLGLLVLAALVYGAVRLSERHRTGGGPHGHSRPDEPWSPPASSDSVDERAADIGMAPTGPTGEVRTGEVVAAGPVIVSQTTFPSTRRSGDGKWAVETHGLTKRFGTTVAIDHVELRVPRGSAFGYLGPNGAGKTTLIRTLLGLTHADAGTMSLLGIPVPSQRRRALARVGAIVDEPRFFHHLTARENLRMLAAARGDDAAGRVAPSLARVGLGSRADEKVGSYSMGMRQRLGVAACLLGDPELLILDEPMNGLDPAGMQQMRTTILGLVEEGRTVVLSSHLLDEVERTCDAVAIVDRGRVVRQGPIDELLRGSGASEVRVHCSDPVRAARIIEEAAIAERAAAEADGLVVTLRAGASRDVVAEINRQLVLAGISVYALEESRASLEDWFLSVTSRLGATA